MSATAERILILEDDTEFAQVLADTLVPIVHALFTAYPDRFFQLLADFKPSLIILDFNLNHPTFNGIKIARLIRQNPEFHLTPIVLLSGVNDTFTIQKAYKSGIDDFIMKPVLAELLIAKLENLLFQSRKKINAQALSGLPGNAAVETEFYLRTDKKTPFSVAYADLNNFKPFNDEKGIKKGDEAILELSRILHNIRSTYTRNQLFVGHIGGDDFLMMGTKTNITKSANNLVKQFKQRAKLFFSSEEIENGHYQGTDRNGRISSFPLLSISVAMIHEISPGVFDNFLDLTQFIAKGKKSAKQSKNGIAQFYCHELNFHSQTDQSLVQNAQKSHAAPKKSLKKASGYSRY